MAYFTMTIYDILARYNKDIDTTKTEQVRDAISQTIESHIDMYPTLGPEHWNQFLMGFTYHYMFEEIGLETEQMFYTALTEKLINNKEYINSIYDQLEKNLFSRYSVNKNIGSDTRERMASSLEEGTTDVMHEDVNSRIASGAKSDKSLESEASKNAESTDANDETKSSEVRTRSNMDTSKQSQSEASKHQEASQQDLKRAQSEIGQTKKEGGGGNERTHILSNANNENHWRKFSNTPQNGLGPIEEGRYLTSAEQNTAQDSRAESSKDVEKNNSNDQTDVNNVNSGIENQAGSAASQDNAARYSQIENQGAQNDANGKHEENISQNIKSGVNERARGSDAQSSEMSQEGSVSQGKDHNENKLNRGEASKEDGAHQDETENYEMTYDMIMKSDSYMNRIWKLLDPLFMQIYGGYDYGY